MTSRYDPISWFEQNFGIQLKHKIRDEYAGPCPWCGGEDRFRVWRDAQNYACRRGPGHCGREGFLDELTGEKDTWKTLSDHEKRILKLEARQAEIERRQREHEERITALEKMARVGPTAAQTYFENLRNFDGALDYWLSEGIALETIERHKLGYCERCPTDKEGRPSFTIPVYSNGRYWNIRHRLLGADADKYRPHMADLPTVLFNADFLRVPSPVIQIHEGEKKSMVAEQLGYVNVGIFGKEGFNELWLPKFRDYKWVYVIYDPDARGRALETAAMFDGRARVVDLPGKFDDLVKLGYTRADFDEALAKAWRG